MASCSDARIHKPPRGGQETGFRWHAAWAKNQKPNSISVNSAELQRKTPAPKLDIKGRNLSHLTNLLLPSQPCRRLCGLSGETRSVLMPFQHPADYPQKMNSTQSVGPVESNGQIWTRTHPLGPCTETTNLMRPHKENTRKNSSRRRNFWRARLRLDAAGRTPN